MGKATPLTAPTSQSIRALLNDEDELALRVVPRAKIERAAIENRALKLWTRTAPEDGTATKAVLAQVAALLDVPVRDVVLVSGANSRKKRIRVGEVLTLKHIFHLDRLNHVIAANHE